VVTKGINFRGEYDPGGNTQYQEGDIVRRGGALWVSLTNQFTDDSSLRPIDTTNWQLVALIPDIDQQLQALPPEKILKIWGRPNLSGNWLLVEYIEEV
jgi:hypothetical protein